LATRADLYRETIIEELDPAAAIRLLRQRGCHGTDHQLKRIAEEQGLHSLSVDLVGGYIARFCDGDPTQAHPDPRDLPGAQADASLAPEVAAIREQERKFARLARRYHDTLAQSDPAALALLQRICLFRVAVDATTLGEIFIGAGKVSISGKHLASLSKHDLHQKLALLSEMRLLDEDTSLPQSDSSLFTIHPAVRDGFFNSLDTDTARANHEATRKGLESALDDRRSSSLLLENGGFHLAEDGDRIALETSPDEKYPSDPATLDLLEEIVYHTFAAGSVTEGWNIYWGRIGNTSNLAHRIGNFDRGARICRNIIKNGCDANLKASARAALYADYSMYLRELGYLEQAEGFIRRSIEIRTKHGLTEPLSLTHLSLASTCLRAGKLRFAVLACVSAIKTAREVESLLYEHHAHVYSMRCHTQRGEIARAKTECGKATNLEDALASDRRFKRYSGRRGEQAILLALQGRVCESHALALTQLEITSDHLGAASPYCAETRLVLADIDRRLTHVQAAKHHLEVACEWSLAHDAKELLCWSALLRGRAEPIVSPDPPLIEPKDRVVIEGLKLARSCGFGLYHIDLLLERARLHLFRGDPGHALEGIELALNTGIPADEQIGQPRLLAATDEECGYAWGIVEGMHLRGEAFLLQAAQALGCETFNRAERDHLPSEVSEMVTRAESCLNDAMCRWHDLRDPQPTEDNNFVHPATGVEYNYKAADTYRILDDLSRGLLTTYPLRDITMKDFFISYNGNDKQWAEWIAWKLEEAGFTTVIQAWDFRAGGDFVMEMQKAATGTDRTIAVLSDNYLNAEFTQPEWGNAFARDPQGHERTLVPVRIARCKPTGLLTTRIYIDLVGLSEDEARDKLIESLKDRGKPATSPAFPGAGADQSPKPATEHPPQSFPGRASTAVAVWQEKLGYFQQQEAITSDPAQKFSLNKLIEEVQQKIAELSANP